MYLTIVCRWQHHMMMYRLVMFVRRVIKEKLWHIVYLASNSFHASFYSSAAFRTITVPLVLVWIIMNDPCSRSESFDGCFAWSSCRIDVVSHISNCFEISNKRYIISLLKTRAPGDVCSVTLTDHCSACEAVAKALSIIWFAVLMFSWGWVWHITCRISPIIWYICSHMELTWGFFTVVGTDWTPILPNSSWKS